MPARSGDAVQNCQAELVASAEVGVAPLEQQAEAGEIDAAVGPLKDCAVRPDAQRLLEDVEPARIVAWPVDVRERHADDLGISAAGGAPQELVRERLSAVGLVAVLGFAGEHLTCELGLTVESRGAGGGDAAVTREQLDHFQIAAAVSVEHWIAARI